VTGARDKLLSGWQLNIIGEIQSGTPTAMPGGILRQESAKLDAGEQTYDRWFDNSTNTNRRPDGDFAWAVIPPNDFRTINVRFSDIRDPWRPQWALSLFKNTLIREKYNLQFRVEAFNALNTPIYGGPDTGINSTRFGRITLNQINFPRHIQLGLRFAF
jgi:trimeric autotransporter adhesin